MSIDRGQRIFLAHGSEDKEQVRTLCANLRRLGFEPWLDEEDLVAGQNWREEIPRAIRGAAVFLACLSSHTVDKDGYVQNEFRLALSTLAERPPGSIYLVPVRLDDCEIPDLHFSDRGVSLRELHWVDLWRPNGLNRLAEAIELALAGKGRKRQTERKPPDESTPPQPVLRYAFAIVVIVMFMGAIGALVRDFASDQEQPEPNGSHEPSFSPKEIEARLEISPGAWLNIQRGLSAEGFDPRGIDGVTGPNTRAAIRRWQASRRFQETGFLDGKQLSLLLAAGTCNLIIKNRILPLQAEPNIFSEEIATVTPGTYRLLNYTRITQPHSQMTELWFKIRAEGRTGWIKGDTWSVERRTGYGCP